MNFDMTQPCPQCPFRSDVRPYLRRDRATEIADVLTRRQGTFSCHKTVAYDDDGEPVSKRQEQHCAGALIVLEKIGRPNQLMRIMERLGGYDARKLQMDAPVFATLQAFIRAQGTRAVASGRARPVARKTAARTPRRKAKS